ncbi:MAG: 1-acyl-sn-glycerol-3-phosphate acyltransferase [Acetobacteraceae bacterium]|nr:1-acyl-sn-glycerol-3-phosphate acyltransferase [Acetobacteraceae bacterium]
MLDPPRRLRRAAHRPTLPPDARVFGADAEPMFSDPAGTETLGSLRAIRRLLCLFALTLVCMPVQAVLLAVPGRAKVAFARFYWRTFTRLLGVRVRQLGTRAVAARPVVFVANHTSWLDIPVLGGQLDACFISKSEVADWPLVGWVAKLGRTVFISRNRGATIRERDSMRARLAAGDNLILFPEGTTSDGSRVMPFRSALFAVAQTANGQSPPLIQPVSLVYDRLAGLPTGRSTRPLFAWYGDMDLATHYWRLARYRGLRATMLLHPPLEPAAFADRKALTQSVWRVVAEGAAQLRQNRPARPIPVNALIVQQ